MFQGRGSGIWSSKTSLVPVTMPFEKFTLDPQRDTSSRARREPAEVTRSIGNARYHAVMNGGTSNGGAAAPLVEASVDPLTPVHLRRQGSVEMPAVGSVLGRGDRISLDGEGRPLEEIPLADVEAGRLMPDEIPAHQ
jgi:hypothetical protein